MSYRVFVDDNFHYMDETERYSGGAFETWEEAVAHCKAIVDQWLLELYEPGMTAQQLLARYKTFGEDPFIVCHARCPPFSAWTYAEERSQAICKAT